MIQPIYLYGSEVLKARAQEVDLTRKEELTQLINDLKDTLAVADGCGLAAPQIGVSQRVLIVDGTVMADVYDYLADFKRVMINPIVLEESENKCEYNEGCLSIPASSSPTSSPPSARRCSPRSSRTSPAAKSPPATKQR